MSVCKSFRCFQWESSHVELSIGAQAMIRQIQTASANPWLFDPLQASLSHCCFLWIATPSYMWDKAWNKVQDAMGSGLDQFLSNKTRSTSCWQKAKFRTSVTPLFPHLALWSKILFISNRLAAALSLISKDHKITNLLENSWCILLKIYDQSLICSATHVIYCSYKSYWICLRCYFLLLMMLLLCLLNSEK